jgi:hypothetical protein
MKNSDKKAKFRQTKEWKEFRKKIFDKQGGIDIITGKKLYKGWTLHHIDMTLENYDKLDEENFIAINKSTHEVLHTLFRYYKNDKDILNRIQQILDKMCELNN